MGIKFNRQHSGATKIPVLERDFRFDDIVYSNDDVIWLFNDSGKHSAYCSDLYDLTYDENQDLTDGKFSVTINTNPKEEKRRNKEWEELMWGK